MTKIMRSVVAIIALFALARINALPDGAPGSVCSSLKPFHSGGIAPQTGISPYSIVARRQNGAVILSVGSALGVKFQGFLIQGRTPAGQAIGEFDTSGAAPFEGHAIDCSGSRDSITHNSPDPKDNLNVIWRPPQGYTGDVVFNSTIAQSYDTFWVGETSPAVQISDEFTNDPIPQNPNFGAGTRGTTTPNFVPDRPEQKSVDFDPIYEGCETNKQCFGAPANCIKSKSCKALVAVTVSGDRYDFEMRATDNAAWVGVGLSDDTKMGEDSVIECAKRDGGNSVAAHMSWTTAAPYSSTRLANSQLGIQLLASSISDGVIYCKVRRDVVTNVMGKVFDLSKDKYNLLVAAGASVEPKTVKFHGIAFLASSEPKALSDVSSVKAASKILIYLHGSFMIVAWIGTASIGILLGRYYRQMWTGSTFMGKDIWFAWHRNFMVLTWLLTIAGFVLIFVELKAWSAERNPHAILGTVTTILCFFQPIGAYFRPHPGTSRRPVFNWLHWLVGNSAYIIAIVTIFYSIKLTKAQLPEFADWILMAYVIVYVVTHLALSMLNCFADKSQGRVSSFPMKNLGASDGSPYSNGGQSEMMVTLRKFILGIYIVITVLVIIAMVVLVVFAPIEETWSAFKSA